MYDGLSGLGCSSSAWQGSSGIFGIPWFLTAEPDLVGDVVEFLAADFAEGFAAAFEVFVDLDGLLDHHLVGALRATDHGEVRSGGDPFVPVGIEPYAEEDCLPLRLFNGLLRHWERVISEEVVREV